MSARAAADCRWRRTEVAVEWEAAGGRRWAKRVAPCCDERTRLLAEAWKAVAVKADEECDFAAAVALYSRSVELIKLGLQHQREGELVDNTILHRYCKLYSERIAMLGSYSEAQSPALAADPADRSAAVIAAPGGSGLLFTFDDSDIVQAAAPPPEPADEWRRPFWLMGILRTSISSMNRRRPWILSSASPQRRC